MMSFSSVYQCLLSLCCVLLINAIYANANACCSFPCLHRGVCMPHSMGYTCDCDNTGYEGENCQVASTYKKWLIELIRPSPETLNYLITNPMFKWLWDFINVRPFLYDRILTAVYVIRSATVTSPPLYSTSHDYTTLDVTMNKSYYARALPPIPKDCPTAMGVAGPKVLPDAKLMAEKLFKRKEFIPSNVGTNIFFSFFAQHFSHMYFKTDFNKGPGFTWGGDGVDVSNVYGHDKHTQNLLRSFKHGKMKTQVINGEEWPPSVESSPVRMIYPPHISKDQQFAMGHRFFALVPGLTMFATIWIREHNRVCNVLLAEHPYWDDEQIYQTARLIILGETIKIVIEDYVQHLSQYNLKLEFRPELLFSKPIQYQNRINIEFNHLYHWHPLMPDQFEVNGVSYPVKYFLFNNDILVQNGMKKTVESFVKQIAGKMTHTNHGISTLHVSKETILHGRELRLQPLNNYRRRFRLKPYTSFEDLTGEKEVAKLLKGFYWHIDAVEFYVGLLVEKVGSNSMLGSTVVEVGGPMSIKGLLSSVICSPLYWRPSTFGGDVGFDIVKTATLEKLFCANIDGECPRISFSVPKEPLNKTSEFSEENISEPYCQFANCSQVNVSGFP